MARDVVGIPLDVLHVLLDGFNCAGDGGPDPLEHKDRELVREWHAGLHPLVQAKLTDVAP